MNSYHNWGAFRTQSNIYHGVFKWKPLAIFFSKSSILHVWLGSNTPLHIEISCGLGMFSQVSSLVDFVFLFLQIRLIEETFKNIRQLGTNSSLCNFAACFKVYGFYISYYNWHPIFSSRLFVTTDSRLFLPIFFLASSLFSLLKFYLRIMQEFESLHNGIIYWIGYLLVYVVHAWVSAFADKLFKV